MNKVDIAKNFDISFSQASGNIAASTYSGLIRFVAIMLVIIAMIWAINHFMSNEERMQDSFLIHLGSRLVRIAIGISLFILILIVKGN
jgi:uncharacterized membrane protein YidH (DUF202 family)